MKMILDNMCPCVSLVCLEKKPTPTPKMEQSFGEIIQMKHNPEVNSALEDAVLKGKNEILYSCY